MSQIVPEGFSRHFRRSALTDPWEPLYSQRTEEGVCVGVVASAAHTNSRGFVHGGLIAALADNAMGLSCAEQLDSAVSLVTVNLAIDYLGSATVGQWLQVTPTVVKV